MVFTFINKPENGKRKNSRKLITVENFFESEENVGYMKPTTLLALMEQLRRDAPGLYAQYHNFFGCVKEGFTIRNTVQKQTHRVNLSDYYHLRFSRGKQFVPTTVYEIEGLGRFITDYASGSIEIDFTLAELIEASKNH